MTAEDELSKMLRAMWEDVANEPTLLLMPWWMTKACARASMSKRRYRRWRGKMRAMRKAAL